MLDFCQNQKGESRTAMTLNILRFSKECNFRLVLEGKAEER